jgi:hypothetical protein
MKYGLNMLNRRKEKRTMKFLIFYLCLLAFICYGIAEVKKTLPLAKQARGLIENRTMEIEKCLINLQSK